jgi:hypothetical protein
MCFLRYLIKLFHFCFLVQICDTVVSVNNSHYTLIELIFFFLSILVCFCTLAPAAASHKHMATIDSRLAV